MKNLAKELKFEEADKIKKDILAINSINNHQIVRDYII
jgi:excinuclease UvrABC nuclease subunit